MPSKHFAEIDEKDVQAMCQKYFTNYQLHSMIIAALSPMQPRPVEQQRTGEKHISDSN